MEHSTSEGFDPTNHADMIDDLERIVGYRAISLAQGMVEGSEEQVLWAWQWLSNHPDVTNHLGGWFRRRVDELRGMGRIK
jgi:hypothetical protein